MFVSVIVTSISLITPETLQALVHFKLLSGFGRQVAVL